LTYKLQAERRVRRAIDALPQRDYLRIERAIDGLANEPRPRGTKKLRGGTPLWRLRVGEYRVIYAVFDRELIVKIVGVARRREDTYEV